MKFKRLTSAGKGFMLLYLCTSVKNHLTKISHATY